MFAVAGFAVDNNDISQADDEIITTEVIQLANQMNIELNNEDLLSFDDIVPTEDTEDWEQAIINEIKCNEDDESSLSEEETERTEQPSSSTGVISVLNYKEILQFAEQLKTFAVNKDEKFLNIADQLLTLTQEKVLEQKLSQKQIKITAFLTKPPV
jgi:hypothetical protein